MKPLLGSSIKEFLSRFEYFKDGEIKNIEIISPTAVKLFLNTQDKNRGYDWIGIEFLFEDITDARILENSKLSFIDMGDGITILYEDQQFSFAIGQYKELVGTKNASLYIIAKSLKYIETQANL